MCSFFSTLSFSIFGSAHQVFIHRTFSGLFFFSVIVSASCLFYNFSLLYLPLTFSLHVLSSFLTYVCHTCSCTYFSVLIHSTLIQHTPFSIFIVSGDLCLRLRSTLIKAESIYSKSISKYYWVIIHKRGYMELHTETKGCIDRKRLRITALK